MKIMKTRILLLIGALIFAGLSLQAQHKGPHHRPHKGGGLFEMINQSKEELQLTPEQETALGNLEVESKAEMEALKAQEFDSREEKHQAFRAMKQSHKEKVDAILTDEQHAILKANRKEKIKAHHEMMQKVDKKKLRAELKQYQQENIEPVMLEKRAALEEVISEEDKATLASLRPKFEARKQDMKQKHKEMKEKRKEMKKECTENKEECKKKCEGKGKGAMHEGHQGRKHHASSDDPDVKALRSLAEKYETEIDALLEPLADLRKQWEADKKAIMERYLPEGAEPMDGKLHKFMSPRKEGMAGKHHGHFLLLDPNKATANNIEAAEIISNAKIFPNPASSEMTLSYELQTEGWVQLELKDEDGRLVKALEEGNKAAGTQQLLIDVSGLRNGVYYISILSQGKQSVVQAVVAKN
jgi:hypothetical protein